MQGIICLEKSILSVFVWSHCWFCVIYHFVPHRISCLCLYFSAIQVLGYYIRKQQDPETFINEIKYIASDPDDEYFFNVTDEAALNDIVDALGDRIFTLEGEGVIKVSVNDPLGEVQEIMRYVAKSSYSTLPFWLQLFIRAIKKIVQSTTDR